MSEHLNPFLDSDNFIEPEIPAYSGSPEQRASGAGPKESDGVTLDHLALKLIKDNLILTALELHTELVESGRELPRLRDFFSNPANFERTKASDVTSPSGLRKCCVNNNELNEFRCHGCFCVNVITLGWPAEISAARHDLSSTEFSLVMSLH